MLNNSSVFVVFLCTSIFKDQKSVVMSQSEVIAILKRYLTQLKEEGVPIERAILYGSYARHEANENSDIDILIVSTFFESEEISNKLLAWKIVRDIDSRIEPVTMGPERFKNDDTSPIIAIAKKEGIVIAC